MALVRLWYWPMKCLFCSSVDGDGDLLQTFGKTFFDSESTLTVTVLLVNDSFRGVQLSCEVQHGQRSMCVALLNYIIADLI